jgi:uncharacterized membrane protein YuzA (DUF378 family)
MNQQAHKSSCHECGGVIWALVGFFSFILIAMLFRTMFGHYLSEGFVRLCFSIIGIIIGLLLCLSIDRIRSLY